MVIIMIGVSNQYSMSNTDTNVMSIYPHKGEPLAYNISDNNTHPHTTRSYPEYFRFHMVRIICRTPYIH